MTRSEEEKEMEKEVSKEEKRKVKILHLMEVLPSRLFIHLMLLRPSVDDGITDKMSLAGVTPALSASLMPPEGQT